MRRLLPEEVGELTELEAELFPYNCFNEYTLQHELEVSQCWVEVKRSQLVGYILVRIEDGMLDILRLGVRPGNHRQGIASRLLMKVLPGAPRAMLTVKKGNKPALSLYFSFGFRIIAHLEPQEAWVMLRSDD